MQENSENILKKDWQHPWFAGLALAITGIFIVCAVTGLPMYVAALLLTAVSSGCALLMEYRENELKKKMREAALNRMESAGESTLKPCPFCGCANASFSFSEDRNGWRAEIGCPECSARLGTKPCATKRDARAEAFLLWQKRK